MSDFENSDTESPGYPKPAQNPRSNMSALRSPSVFSSSPATASQNSTSGPNHTSQLDAIRPFVPPPRSSSLVGFGFSNLSQVPPSLNSSITAPSNSFQSAKSKNVFSFGNANSSEPSMMSTLPDYQDRRTHADSSGPSSYSPSNRPSIFGPSRGSNTTLGNNGTTRPSMDSLSTTGLPQRTVPTNGEHIQNPISRPIPNNNLAGGPSTPRGANSGGRAKSQGRSMFGFCDAGNSGRAKFNNFRLKTDASKPVEVRISEYTTGPLVQIFVGPEKKLFNLHLNLICAKSEYFRAAFQGSFKESHEKAMYLEEEESEAFSYIVDYLYTSIAPHCTSCAGRPFSPSVHLPLSPGHTLTDAERSHPLIWIKLHILADQLQLPSLAESATHTYHHCHTYLHTFPTVPEALLIYTSTPSTSSLRRILISLLLFYFFRTPFVTSSPPPSPNPAAYTPLSPYPISFNTNSPIDPIAYSPSPSSFFSSNHPSAEQEQQFMEVSTCHDDLATELHIAQKKHLKIRRQNECTIRGCVAHTGLWYRKENLKTRWDELEEEVMGRGLIERVRG